MNLGALGMAYVSAVNPNVIGAVQVSTGYTTGADGSRAPTYQTFPNQTFQVQALTSGDLRLVDNLNLQSVNRAVYLNGNIEGLDRPAGKGGDILLFNGQTWLVTNVLEPWNSSGWTKVVVVLQNGS